MPFAGQQNYQDGNTLLIIVVKMFSVRKREPVAITSLGDYPENTTTQAPATHTIRGTAANG
jgi:hypothetical protein